MQQRKRNSPKWVSQRIFFQVIIFVFIEADYDIRTKKWTHIWSGICNSFVSWSKRRCRLLKITDIAKNTETTLRKHLFDKVNIDIFERIAAIFKVWSLLWCNRFFRISFVKRIRASKNGGKTRKTTFCKARAYIERKI